MIVCEELLEQAIHMHIAFPALAGCKIEFKVGIAASRIADVIERSSAQRRASEIRVQDHTSGIDDWQ